MKKTEKSDWICQHQQHPQVLINGDNKEVLAVLASDDLYANKVSCIYIDPPYNGRQYLPNYHVLETAAKYDFPEVRGVTGQRSYENQKSDFCLKTKVASAFEKLIQNAQFKHIVLSYSTDGLMSLDEIENTMKKYGKPESFMIYWIPYRRYKSRAQGDKEVLKEMLVYVEKQVK